MTRDQFISLFFIALLIFIIYEIVLIFSPFINSIFWAAILAFGFFPLYEKINSLLKQREMPAALLTTGIIFLIVILPLIILIINITGQAIELYQAVVLYVREGRLEQLIDQIRSWQMVQNIEVKIVEWEPLKQNAAQWLLNSTKAFGNFAASQAGSLTKGTLFIFLNMIIIFFLLFIFLKDGRKIYEFIYNITPIEKENKGPIFQQINDTFGAVIRGQVFTSLTQAILAGTIFWILGMPVPILFGTATFIAALIPVAGPAIIWLPSSVYLFVNHHYVKAGILFFFGLLVISLVDNIMKPMLIGEKTKLPYFLLFFGIIGGLKLYGLMGIFLAPAILSVFFSLIKIYQQKYL